MKKTILALAVALFAWTAFVQAQTPISIVRGQQFAVEWNSQYPNTETLYKFAVFVDNTQTKLFTQAELTVTPAPLTDCPVPTGVAAPTTCFLYRGTHPALQNTGNRSVAFRITDVTSGLNSAMSTAVPIVVVNPTLPPNAPANGRVVVIVQQAGINFEFKSQPAGVTVATSDQALTTVKIPVQR